MPVTAAVADNGWLVVLKQGVDLQEHMDWLSSLISLQVPRFFLQESTQIWLKGYSLPSGVSEQILELLRNLREVDYLEPDSLCSISHTLSEPNPANWVRFRIVSYLNDCDRPCLVLIPNGCH
jgi:hypothetical protein